MYFKEFSCNQAENMQARCVPRFIQRFPKKIKGTADCTGKYGRLLFVWIIGAPAVRFAEQNARKRGGFAASAAALCERSGAGAHYLGQKRHGESARNCTKEALIKSGMQIAQTDFSQAEAAPRIARK